MTAQSAGSKRIGIVGVSHWHVPLYLPGFESANVVGLWDNDVNRARHLAEVVGATPYHSRESLFDQDIDLAFIFGDPWEMLASARECVRRRIPFSVEKPAAPSLRELEELTDDAARAEVAAFVPLVLRTSGLPGVISHLGHLRDMHAQYLTGPASRYTAGGFDWAVNSSVLGAGSLHNLAPHFVDLFSMAVGTRDHAVEFLHASHPASGEADDSAHIFLRSGGDSSAAIGVGYTTPHPAFSVGPRAVLTGTTGALVVDEAGAQLLRPDGSSSAPDVALQWGVLFPAYVRALLAPADGELKLPRLSDLRDIYQILQAPSNGRDATEHSVASQKRTWDESTSTKNFVGTFT